MTIFGQLGFFVWRAQNPKNTEAGIYEERLGRAKVLSADCTDLRRFGKSIFVRVRIKS